MRCFLFLALCSAAALAQEDPAELRDRASRLVAQGKYAGAEPLLAGALGAQEKALGLDDPRLADTIAALAAVYRAEGRNPDAEKLHLRSLGIREKSGGPDTIDLIADLKPLAALYAARGSFTDAERALLRIIAIREKAKGPD